MLPVFCSQPIKFVKKRFFAIFFATVSSLYATNPSAALVQTSSAQTQIPSAGGTSLIISDSINFSDNFEISADKTSVICKIPGIYLASSGLQPAALTPRVSGYLDSWFIINGKPVEHSNSRQYINENSPVALVSNILLIDLKEKDVFAVGFSSSNPNIGIISIDNSKASEPSITSFGLTLFKINSAGEEAYAQIYSNLTQRTDPIIGKLLQAEHASELKNFEISPNHDFLICKVKGVYFVSCSLQPAALNIGINGHLGAWIELNDKPVSSSSSRVYVTEKSPILLLTIPYLIELNPGDRIGTRFASTGSDIGITYIDTPSTSEPGIPSFTFSIYKVSG